MGERTALLRLKVEKKDADGTLDELVFGPVPDDEEWLVNIVSIENADNNTDRIEWILRTPSGDYVVVCMTELSDQIPEAARIVLTAGPGERLVASVTNAVADDHLIACAIGRKRYL